MGDGGVSQAPCLSSLDSKLLVLTLESRGWVRPLDQSHHLPLLPPSLIFSLYSHSDIINN